MNSFSDSIRLWGGSGRGQGSLKRRTAVDELLSALFLKSWREERPASAKRYFLIILRSLLRLESIARGPPRLAEMETLTVL